MPPAETCNGADDDCDGMVDDGLETPCYPSGTVGCSDDGAGGFSCRGRCAPGKRTCTGGTESECSGAVLPATESCGDDEAGDEDCDGRIDEGCTCSGSETQPCYSASRLTVARVARSPSRSVTRPTVCGSSAQASKAAPPL